MQYNIGINYYQFVVSLGFQSYQWTLQDKTKFGGVFTVRRFKSLSGQEIKKTHKFNCYAI